MTKDPAQDPKVEENISPELNGSGGEVVEVVEHIDLFITIDDKEYKADPPKMKLLRHVIRLNEKQQADPQLFFTEAGIDEIMHLLVAIFNNENITIDNIENADLSTLYTLQNINDWINQYMPEKNIREAMQVSKMRENQSKSQ